MKPVGRLRSWGRSKVDPFLFFENLKTARRRARMTTSKEGSTSVLISKLTRQRGLKLYFKIEI